MAMLNVKAVVYAILTVEYSIVHMICKGRLAAAKL